MAYEVEQKFAVHDRAALLSRLATRGVALGAPEIQSDYYFNHPSVDYAASDEALRIRTCRDRTYLTYKGPKIDADTKTRREIELPLVSGAAPWSELLVSLRFRPVAEVRKSRRTGYVEALGLRYEIVLDEVDELGDYCELETQAAEAGLNEARTGLQALAAELGLENVERRSYLELLLARRALPRQE